MLKNILTLTTLIIFTIIFIIGINLLLLGDYILFNELNLKFNLVLIVSLLSFFVVIIMLKYIIVLHKHQFNPYFLCIYCFFILSLIGSYFVFYRENTKEEAINNKYFETFLENSLIKKEDNGLSSLGELNLSLQQVDLLGLANFYDDYYCIIGVNKGVCDEEELKAKFKTKNYFQKRYIQNINLLEIIVKKSNRKKYFKQELSSFSDDFKYSIISQTNAGNIIKPYNITSFNVYILNSFYNILYYLENSSKSKALELIKNNYLTSYRIISGDIDMGALTVGFSSIQSSNLQLNYILNNYSFTKTELKQLQSVLEKEINMKTSFNNTLKFEYKEKLERDKLVFKSYNYDNMFFNKKRYDYVLREVFKNMIESKESENIEKKLKFYNSDYLVYKLIGNVDYSPQKIEFIRIINEKNLLLDKIKQKIKSVK